jgi:hypothetical protein
MKATYIWQMATKLGTVQWYFFFNFDLFVCVFFVRFSTRGVQKHHKNFLGEVHVKSLLPKKMRKHFFPVVFPFDSLHEELKNTIKHFLKSDLKISKNLKKSTMVFVVVIFLTELVVKHHCMLRTIYPPPGPLARLPPSPTVHHVVHSHMSRLRQVAAPHSQTAEELLST